MSVKNGLKILLIFSLLVNVLLACNVLPDIQRTHSTTSMPVGYSGSTPPQLNTWNKWAPGVELRYEHWKGASDNEDTVVIARFDLHHVHIRIGYQPSQP